MSATGFETIAATAREEQAATARVLPKQKSGYRARTGLLIVVAGGYTIGPGWRVLLSGQRCTKYIGTRDNRFVFKILHPAGDLKVPFLGGPGQAQRSLRVGVLLAVQVALSAEPAGWPRRVP